MLEPEKEKLWTPEKELEPETEKLAKGRSRCPRSSTLGRFRKGKATRKQRVWTQDMIEEGLRFLD